VQLAPRSTQLVPIDDAIKRSWLPLYPVYRWVMRNEINERFEHLNRYPVGH